MTPLQRYVAEEIAIDHADGLLSRREALRRLALLGLGLPAATALLAACASDAPPAPPAAPAADRDHPGVTRAGAGDRGRHLRRPAGRAHGGLRGGGHAARRRAGHP